MTPVVVLGAGKVGKLVCHLLAHSGDYKVTAADSSLAQSQQVLTTAEGKKVPNLESAVCDFGNDAQIRSVLAGKKYALSCAPYSFNLRIARLCKELGVNYLDLTEDVATTKGVKELAVGASQAFIPQCGLAPGFITIVAAHTAEGFERLDTVKMRVGALPIYPHNRLKYNLTWSTEGLINEYGNPCEAVVDGKLTLVAPLEGHEIFSIDGLEYEAFNTSGGLGTLAESWSGKVREMNYRSIRYPGHRDIIALLMNDLKLNDDRETMKRIFEHALPHTYQDVVLIVATVAGSIKGRLSQKSYIKKIYNQTIGGEQWGAIQITTAAGICAVLDLHREGVLPKSGFVKQEDVPFDKFITNRFGKYYA